MSMEVEHPSPSSHTEDQAGENDRSNWSRRLRLRKPSAFSHTVKSLIEEQKVDKELTKKTSQNKQKNLQVADTLSSKLTFTCSDCKDGTRFSPDGLLKHFKNFHGGKGHSPTFSCNICSFVASDFSTLQQHYLKHEHPKPTYDVRLDNGLQSKLTQNCIKHIPYQCEKCQSSAKELTNVLHNSCPHNTIPDVDSCQKSDVKSLSALNRKLWADAAGESKEDAHLSAACHRGWIRKNLWKNRDVGPKQPKCTTPDTKFVIPKSETPWTSAKFLPFSAAGLLDENGELLHPTRTLEVTKQFLERTVNCGQKWPTTLTDEPGAFVSEPKMKRCATPFPVLNSGNHLSGLMDKNKLSVPPDCITKVVGFKMVDGKKHLVVKVIPSAKPEISSVTRKCGFGNHVGLTQEERNNNNYKLDSHIARTGDQMCSNSGDVFTEEATFNSYDSTATSFQPQIQGCCEEKDEARMVDAPQVDNTGHDCSNDRCPDASAQLALPVMDEVYDVASQMKNRTSAYPEITFNINDTTDLGGETEDALGKVSSVRKEATLQTNMKKISYTLKHTGNLEAAAGDHKVRTSKPSPSQDARSCIKALSSITYTDCTERGISSQPFALMSEKDNNPDIYMDKKAEDEATVIHSSLNDWTEQKWKKVLNSPTMTHGVAMLESDITGPTGASHQTTTTDSLFIFQCEHGSLLFQNDGDENMNNMDSMYTNVCLGQACTMVTVQEPNFLLPSLHDSCHNSDLYQTLDKLPLTTVSHLLDDSEAAYTGVTSQSEAVSMYAQQQSVHSSKATPVTAVTNDKEVLQQPPGTEPDSRKRRWKPTSKDSQGLLSKSKRRRVQNCQANNFAARNSYWEPPPLDIERTLLLSPFRASQAVKVPRLNQPVVVLNHPDADIPDVRNIMRSVHRHNGAVQRVVLSLGTLKSLSELNCDTFRNKRADNSQSPHYRRAWPQETVKERFMLNLKLKRIDGNKFKVEDQSFNANQIQSSFTCWFCGRHFRNQEVWVGHGQRHIMEATRDWNMLVKQ